MFNYMTRMFYDRNYLQEKYYYVNLNVLGYESKSIQQLLLYDVFIFVMYYFNTVQLYKTSYMLRVQR